MSTVPVAGVPPGRRLEAVRIALLAALLNCDSVPVLNTFDGFADAAVKSAPEATVTPTAASTVASVARVRRGCRGRGGRDMGLQGRMEGGRPLREPSRRRERGRGGSAVTPAIGWNRFRL